jgi:PAS domain S-box-containing protein
MMWTAMASVAASEMFGPVAWAAPFFGCASILEAATAAFLLRRWLGHRDPFEGTRSIVVFTAAAGILGPATGALIGATAAQIALHKPWGPTFSDWVLGRGLGSLIASPIVGLLIAGERRAWAQRLTAQLWGEGGVLLAAVAVITACVFWQERLPLLFLPALPILLATFKLGRPGAALSILIVAVIGGTATASGYGPVMMTSLSRVEQLQFFQLYLAATFLMSLPIAGTLDQREQLMLAARENNRLFKLAGSLASIGHWRIDLAAEKLVWSDEVFRIYGLEPGSPPLLANAIAFYHPDDRKRVEKIVNDAVAERRDFAYGARLMRADGSTRHVVAQGQVELDDNGTALCIFGVFQDVTERELAAETLRNNETRFQLITQQASDMIALINLDGVCLFMSRASETILGISPAEMIGSKLIERVHEEDQPAVQRYRKGLHTRTIAAGTSQRFRVARADGNYAWIEASSRLAAIGETPCIVAVWRDVTQQVAIEAELKAAKLAAEEASTAKAGFLANMSHEIRTPMNGVIGFAELLLTSDLTDEQRRDAGLIADSGRAMMKLLNDILDLSKIEAGQLDVVTEPFDLPHALRSCSKLLGPSAAQKHLGFKIMIADDVPPMVMGDALRVRQIVLNLLGNALKFTERGEVALTAYLAKIDGVQRLMISVSDTGIGIAPERQASIFEEFVQADHSITRRYGGSGLGLAISNRLARLLGGCIDLESRPGRGTTVTLQLPAVVAEKGADFAQLPAAGLRRMTQQTCRVLLAEDHEVNQLLVRAMLAQKGHDVTVVSDGLQAVDEVRRSVADGAPFDLVLMDMQMPVMDGLAATRAIRATEQSGDGRLPIVALTANAFASDLEVCRAAGMDDHVAKPVSMEALLLAVDRWSRSPQGAALVATAHPPSTSKSVNSPIPTQVTPAIASPSEPGTQGRVLVAEDHDVNQLLISAMLKQLGWVADIAADGSEAIALIDAAREDGRPYNVVLMDIQMPVMGGPEATRQMRQRGIAPSELPIVALTANTFPEDISSYLAIGMQGHLAKPVTLAALDQALRRWALPIAVPSIKPRAPAADAGPSAKIRERYKARKQETLDALSTLVRRGLFSQSELNDASGLLHKLAGTAAMFQEADLGDRARALEEGIKTWDEEHRADQIRAAVESIRSAA